MAAALKSVLRPFAVALALGVATTTAAAAQDLPVAAIPAAEAPVFGEQNLVLSLDMPRHAWGLRGWSRLGLTATRPMFGRRPVVESRADTLFAPVAQVAAPLLQRVAASGPADERTGRASWIGAAGDGKLTASGERFDMYRLTAASADLPLGAYVAVTNKQTGETVTVRIIDRKPADGEMLTLSQAAAYRIGLDQTPDALVAARYVGDAPPARVMTVAMR